MTWTPLITPAAFDGIQADVLTVGAGVLTVALAILGIGIIWKVLVN